LIAAALGKRAASAAARLRPYAGLMLVALAVLVVEAAGVLQPLDDALAALRMELIRRDAAPELTVVEIDQPSLAAVGRWPWSRERFSRAIENLEAAGAEAVAFDVDFSASAPGAADQALQAAIERRPGTVILPTFVQAVGPAEDGRWVENAPLKGLARDAVLASVNVPLDHDGRARRYQYGFGDGESYRASMASALAGAPPGRVGAFLIDYGIRLESLGHLSFEDVYQGRFDPRLVKGRRVLIGATAQELGDDFADPRGGTLSGVYVHALAFESIRSGRDLKPLNPWLGLILALAAAAWLRPRRNGSPIAFAARHLIVASVALAGPIALEAVAPVSADAGILLFAQVVCLGWAVQAELRRRAQAIVREREASLLHLALHEPETELPNRRALLQEVAQRLEAAPERPLAVLAVGIDRFASLRGAIGYQRFTKVVRQVAERTRQATGATRAAHLSTSVIGVVIDADSAADLGAAIASVEALDPWLSVESLSVDAFVRTGVAYLAAAPDDTAEALLENASIALDRARETDRRLVTFDRAAFPDPSLNIALMSDMVRGLAAGELQLHYQPKFSVASGEVVSAEALVRWTHPVRGFISPETLVTTAEETGMIRTLTEWALATAIADLKTLNAAGHDLTIAVNISGALIADRELRKNTLKACRGYEHRLCLEITESAIIGNPGHAMAAIADYRDAGVKISIDDYGSGLSSLAYLKMIDADELKLDKSLVTALAESARDRLILKSTIDLAHSLSMSVVAEGVETQDVLAALEGMDCDIAQGWLFSKAVPFDRLVDLLTTRRASRAA
jgi:EAL domain-containing protein (putative c-di-GMP-specific phosphodiesterase class I)/CHASE2 domain-containing sensor protein/GGDEF domain-containing protein